MKYRISWIDATLTENYDSMVAENPEIVFTNEGSQESDNWTDFSAHHDFMAMNDEQAIQYLKNFDYFMFRAVDVYTLSGADSGLIYTEENERI